MEEERQEEQEQRAMAVQAGARCRLGNYLGWLAQDLVSQRLLFSLSCLCSVVFARSHVCVLLQRRSKRVGAFVHRWDAAIVLDSDRGSILSKRVMYNLPR